MPNQLLFAAVVAWVSTTYPGRVPRRVKIHLNDGESISLIVPAAAARPASTPAATFVTTSLQDRILDALAGRALRTDGLAAAVDCDRSQLFKRGGLKELVEQGWVARHPRAGYYRPDDPPSELEEG